MVQYTKMGECRPASQWASSLARRLDPDFKVISTGIGFVNIFGDTFPFEEHRRPPRRGSSAGKRCTPANGI